MPHCNPILAVSELKKCGLILCKAYHADFAGPGAAVGSPVEQGYNVIIAIGEPDLVPVYTSEDRQKAYSRRIRWMRWLERITNYPDPAARVEKLLSGFEAFFSRQAVMEIPDEALALLVGVLPQTIRTIRLQHYGVASSKGKPRCARWESFSEPAIAAQTASTSTEAVTENFRPANPTSPCLSVYNFSRASVPLVCSA